MKRTITDENNTLTSSALVSLDGYIVHINKITKNNTNDNHHYSFILCIEDQSTVRVIKYLSKRPYCLLHNRLRESLRSGRGASITSLREQNNQYSCTVSTKVIDKDLNFRPECIRVKNINILKNQTNDKLCTVEAQICSISDEIAVVFEENEFKRVQKIKKNMIIGDETGALEMSVWESHFNEIELGKSYHIRLLKIRIYNDQISLAATTETSFIKIDDLPNVITNVDNTINRYNTQKGKIMSIEKNADHYACQCCGSTNIIDEAGIIACIDCHSRLIKDENITDGYLKITISTFNNEQYNLRIAKPLLMLMVAEKNSDSIENSDCINNEYNFNNIIASTVNVTYSEITGIVSDISIVKNNESSHESTLSTMFAS
ncbi:unnamed protein product [Rotaria sordida]|uniref:Uncharacterized protein n=1 Tax=Rotaria sordida TaxID=392033 RepID=A0A814XKG3_9BILA|nr:unnamed protein product [Rotaria sordida]CAF3785383.1 unnamed protein product [Rotaria sordida]